MPCRKEPSHRSEMVTQLLFGEHFTVLEENEEWAHIITAADEYDCWISNKQFLPIKPETFAELQKGGQGLSNEPVQLVQHKNSGTYFPVVIGSTIPFLKDKKFTIENQEYEFAGEYLLPDEKNIVYKLNGFKLLRDASQQATLGLSLSFVEEAQAGDLAFFDNEEGKIIHVGIVLEEGKIIHASGKVRVDKIDHYGIFNVDTKKYSHHLRVIKKLL